MPTAIPDSAEVYWETYFRKLYPDPDVWSDEWVDEYMCIPLYTGAAPKGRSQ